MFLDGCCCQCCHRRRRRRWDRWMVWKWARSKHEGGYNRATSNVQPGAWRRRTRSEHHKYRPTEISLSGSGLSDDYVIISSCPKCGPQGFEPKDYQVTALIMGTSRSCLRWASELASSSTTTTTTTKVCNKYLLPPLVGPEFIFLNTHLLPWLAFQYPHRYFTVGNRFDEYLLSI